MEMRCHVQDSDGHRIYLDWRRADDRPLPAGNSVDNGVLIIPVVDKSAAGEYVCTGRDLTGNVLFRATSVLEVLCKIFDRALSCLHNMKTEVG